MQDREFDQWRVKAQQQFDQWRTEMDGYHKAHVAMIGGVIQFAVLAIKGMAVMNGGAAVALLAFLGHVIASDPNQASTALALKPAMGWFLGGAAAAVATAGVSYFAQVFFSLEKKKYGETVRVAAVLFGLGSIVAFVLGCIFALDAFGDALSTG